jgi:rod shape determining protein RodA
VGVAIGLLPVTGIPLPFMSYGGSALILNMAKAGIMIGAGMRWKDY